MTSPDLQDLRGARLDRRDQEELLLTQSECTLVFTDEDGAPSGTVLSFAYDGDLLWLTSVQGRVHVRAIQRDPSVGIVVSNAGTALPGRKMLSLRGVATLHTETEAAEPALRKIAARLTPGAEEGFLHALRVPGRVAISFRPTRVVASHNSLRLAGDGRGGR
ncbi:pyridoxamine 5'-phosphate oxidase family protein [Microbacterium sp. NPDC055910]|uniref:pyridoxamine 5'-phosphate oxidase family protein n=1 Tax=Microbacterium sp. NPDC055910 TaxID=3345659 RepID=UPI0035DFD996